MLKFWLVLSNNFKGSSEPELINPLMINVNDHLLVDASTYLMWG